MRSRLFALLSLLFQNQLIQQIAYLKCENRILKSRLGKEIRTHLHERKELLKYGNPLGENLKDIISIVSYSTFQAWVRQEKRNASTPLPIQKRGRPRKPSEIKELVLHMARNNQWGYTRILGELHKLGIFRFSRSSVRNILRENGLPPQGKRLIPWTKHLKIHHETLIACDFFKQTIWTIQGPRLAFILFFINLHTRQVQVAGITKYPKAEWVIQQSRKLFEGTPRSTSQKHLLIRDLDSKFTKEFDSAFQNMGFQILKTAYRSPNMNAHAESWIDKIKNECLNYFVIFDLKHLRYLVSEYEYYYNNLRPHMGNYLRPLSKLAVKTSGAIRAAPILGGLFHHYYRE